MKKYISIICFVLVTFTTQAQISSDFGKFMSKLQGIALLGIDSLFLYSNTTSPIITFNYGGTGTVEWYKYTAITPETLVSSTIGSVKNEYQLYIDKTYDEIGYILKINGVKRFTFWAINYEKFTPTASTIFEPNANQANQCKEISIGITNFPDMHYYSPAGIKSSINRICNVKYQTLSWSGKDWQPKDTLINNILLPISNITVPTPYCNMANSNVIFTLSGDQFATDLGITLWSVSSSKYVSNAVICKLTTAVTSRTRDKNNEAEAPADKLPINYSAPIDVQFLSNANEPIAQFYNWTISKGSETPIIRKDKDERYTFTEAGTYKIKVTASNSVCSYSDSISVIVSTSDIKAPNVFTPNGDGFNDEFRVAYKSIISFQCWVYNRWGRLVYTWTDPTKGWDGKINGLDAKPGPYFYVIKAKGSDYDPNSTPDSKTHRRVGEHLLKGDINLLRGVQ